MGGGLRKRWLILPLQIEGTAFPLASGVSYALRGNSPFQIFPPNTWIGRRWGCQGQKQWVQNQRCGVGFSSSRFHDNNCLRGSGGYKKGYPVLWLIKSHSISCILSAAKKGTSLLTTSEEDDDRRADGNLVLSAAETSPQPDAEEDTSYFIPWRKHLLGGRGEPKDLIQKQASPEEKLSRNPEEHQPDDVMAAKASLATSSSRAEVVTDTISSLLSEFRRTVKHADDNVKTFKETCALFQECCDKMCTSMSNLQNVLETLTQILKE